MIRACRAESSTSRCSSSAGTGGPGCPTWQRLEPGAAGHHQPPGGPLAQCEQEQQAAAGRNDVSDAGCEITVEFDVGEQHLLPVGTAAPADARLRAHRAGDAVAAGDRPRDHHLNPGSGAECRPRTSSVASTRSFTSSTPRWTSTPRSASARLKTASTSSCRSNVRCAKAVSGRTSPVELSGDDPGAQVQPDARGDVGLRQQGLDHPERTQHLQRPRMHDQGAGRAEGIRPPLHDSHPSTVVMGLQCEAQSGGAGAHHQQVRPRDHAADTTRHQSAGPTGATASNRCGSASTASRRWPGSTR